MDSRSLGVPPAILVALAGSAAAAAGAGFPALIDLSSLDGTFGFVINGIDPSDASGWSVSGARDVNGDGFDDLLIGARTASPSGGAFAGESYVVFGGLGLGRTGSFELSSLDGTNGFIINGIDSGDQSGHSVACAGDVNGDGIGDLLIGAPYALANGVLRAGESYVLFGGPDVGAVGSIELSALDGSDGFVVNGIDQHDGSGYSVSSAGDVNGDGMDDLIIGSPGGGQSGRCDVIFGAEGVGSDGFIDLSALDGSVGFAINRFSFFGGLGWSVSRAGDVNGDGFGDLVMGARQGSEGNFEGEFYVLFGAFGVGASGSVDLAMALEGTGGFRVPGVNPGDFSGSSVSCAGDANGDGFGDIVIGALGAGVAGESYVVFGGVGVGSGGLLDLSSLNGSDGFVINGVGFDDRSGRSVSLAGDVNGDGVDDVIVGAYGWSFYGPRRAGESYVVFGGSDVGSSGSLDLSSLNGSNGFVMRGIDADDVSGWSVSRAGDVNGDGADDVIVGAPSADPAGRFNAGESYVIFGRRRSLTRASVTGSRETSALLDGRALAPPVVCLGDIDADGDTDVFDFGIFSSNFNSSVLAGTLGDLDGSGFVDVFDLGIFASDFGCSG